VLFSRLRWLKERGIGLAAALSARKSVSYTFASPITPSRDGVPVPHDTLDGRFAHFVWGAMQDQHETESAVAKLPRADRDLLPDVLPTVKALVARVMTIAPMLTDLDRDIQLEDISRLESRIQELESNGQRGASGDRTLQLLLRQLGTLQDLVSRRDTLLAQIESAALLLQNIKLDLRKIGTVGLHSSVTDVNTATQEARALSREIGHVLSAAEDVRRIV
jgi:serine/threonine-protein kinase